MLASSPVTLSIRTFHRGMCPVQEMRGANSSSSKPVATPSGNQNSKKSSNAPESSFVSQQQNCYEGESLADLLKSIQRGIDSTRPTDGALPEKIWIKQHFSIGVNEVTRVLERMNPTVHMESPRQQPLLKSNLCKASNVKLQAIILAWDCNPRSLTKHLASLAASRKVAVILVKDKKRGSQALGELVKLKTAIVIGVKARGNAINQIIKEIVGCSDPSFGNKETENPECNDNL